MSVCVNESLVTTVPIFDGQKEHISFFHMLKPPVSEAVDGRVIQLGSQIGCVRVPRKLTKHKSHVFDDENQKGGTQQHGWNQGILDIRNNILGAMVLHMGTPWRNRWGLLSDG